MIKTTIDVRVRAALLAALVACSACGGGGGGGGGSQSPPPPPPPSPPSAVVASATVDDNSVHEGQPFTLDATGSTTTNGMPLTYAWTQTSGPAVTMTNANTASLTLNAAEVTANTTAQFRVTVTAGTASAAATVSVTFENIAQTPTFGSAPQLLATATFTSPVRKILGGESFALAGISNLPDDPMTFVDFSVASGELQIAPSPMVSLPMSAMMSLSSLYVPSSANNPNPAGSPQFSVIEEDADRFRIFTRSFFDPSVAAAVDIALTEPCGFSHGTLRSSSALYVGQRTGFATIYAGGSEPALDRSLDLGKPLCALLAQTAYSSPGITAAYNKVLALDTDANVFNVFEPDSGAGNANYVLTKLVPVELNATRPLKLVAWTEINLTGGRGHPDAMALVFSDGTHAGEHRLVIANLDAASNVVQQTHSLGLGIPLQVFTDNIDADANFPEIVVVKSSSPQAEIFEPAGSASMLYSGSRFLEIGLGVSSAFRSGFGSLQGIAVAFPDKKQVKVIGATP